MTPQNRHTSTTNHVTTARLLLLMTVLPIMACESELRGEFVTGTSLMGTIYYPDLDTPYENILEIGEDDEFRVEQEGLGGYTLNLQDDIIRFDFFFDPDARKLENIYFVEAAFNGWQFTDIFDELDPFESIELLAGTHDTAWDLIEIGALDEDTLSINFGSMQESPIYDGAFVLFKVDFVPAPGALALFGLGGALIRRRRN